MLAELQRRGPFGLRPQQVRPVDEQPLEAAHQVDEPLQRHRRRENGPTDLGERLDVGPAVLAGYGARDGVKDEFLDDASRVQREDGAVAAEVGGAVLAVGGVHAADVRLVHGQDVREVLEGGEREGAGAAGARGQPDVHVYAAERGDEGAVQGGGGAGDGGEGGVDFGEGGGVDGEDARDEF